MTETIKHLLRELTPQVLGAATRRFGNFAAWEDAVQEALIAAADQWPKEGVPENPRAWLIHVAMRRGTDLVRAEAARRHREQLVVALVTPEQQLAFLPETGSEERDDTLELLFMCCHPSLSTASAIALTLRAVGGLTTAEIASAFLVPEATMAQRISRAKQTIKASGVPFELPSPAERAERLVAVMHVLYLIFNEGYVASTGAELHRTDLSSEAIRLARLMVKLLPEEPEVMGLLGLMLLTDARRNARTGSGGELIPLDEQDRSLWDRNAIAEGIGLVSAALPRGAPGPYQVQAAIAAIHDEATSTDATDWPQILAFYELLAKMDDSPMVALSAAVATAMVHGPLAGLARVDVIANDPRVRKHHRVHAVRAHLLERAGERARAAAEYRLAAALAPSVPEQHYLAMRAASVSDP